MGGRGFSQEISTELSVNKMSVYRTKKHQYHENRWADLWRGQVVVMNIRGAKTGCVFEVGCAREEVMSLQGVVVVWPPDGQVLPRNPAPCTLHPAPCTLHPAPCTLAETSPNP